MKSKTKEKKTRASAYDNTLCYVLNGHTKIRCNLGESWMESKEVGRETKENERGVETDRQTDRQTDR